MEKENKSVLGIAYFYNAIIAFFAIATYLQLLIYNPIDKYYIIAFVLLFGTYAAIWFVLFNLNKKRNQSIGVIFKDCTARKTVGVVVLINILVSFFVFIPATINAVSFIIKDEIDGSVIPNIISVLLLICQVLFGIFLLKFKRKTDGVCISETVIGIALLYTLITFVFSLAKKLSQSIISHNSLNEYFILRFVTLAIILLVLYILNKKRNQSFVAIFNNNIIRKTTSVLIIIDGLISLSRIIITVTNFIWINIFTTHNITQSIIRFIIVAIQILFGIYMLKLYKVKSIDEK